MRTDGAESAVAGDRPALLAAADDAEREGRLLDAIDLLTQANRCQRDGAVEHRLVRVRREAYRLIEGPAGRSEWPPRRADPFAAPIPEGELAEIRGEDLTAELLGGAIAHHGALLVRGLIPPEVAERLTQDVDRAFTASREEDEGAPTSQTAPWFVPYGYTEDGFAMGLGARQWGLRGGGVATVESPPALFDLIEAFEQVGLRDVLTEHLGERPAIAVDKWTLRRVPGDWLRADWHQDGRFLGEGIRTINVWLALSTCGGDTDCAGLDVIPRRIDTIVETGTNGAEFDWTVGNGTVDVLAEQGAGPVRPLFHPGDALLFDELFLHRSGVTVSPRDPMATPGQTMRRDRYAIESWFFAPSSYGDERFPLVF